MKDIQIAIDNLEQLPATERAKVLMTIIRNIVSQADSEMIISLDEIESTIETACRDVGCA
jgi:hypothetical protein